MEGTAVKSIRDEQPAAMSTLQKFLLALNLKHENDGEIYQGTVSAKVKAKRRAGNRVAKASRKANRGK